MKTITFNQAGDFEATRAAEKWCCERGISVGAMQAGSPRALMVGDVVVSKWRNLTTKEQALADGYMKGDGRTSPVIVQLKDWVSVAD